MIRPFRRFFLECPLLGFVFGVVATGDHALVATGRSATAAPRIPPRIVPQHSGTKAFSTAGLSQTDILWSKAPEHFANGATADFPAFTVFEFDKTAKGFANVDEVAQWWNAKNVVDVAGAGIIGVVHAPSAGPDPAYELTPFKLDSETSKALTKKFDHSIGLYEARKREWIGTQSLLVNVEPWRENSAWRNQAEDFFGLFRDSLRAEVFPPLKLQAIRPVLGGGVPVPPGPDTAPDPPGGPRHVDLPAPDPPGGPRHVDLPVPDPPGPVHQPQPVPNSVDNNTFRLGSVQYSLETLFPVNFYGGGAELERRVEAPVIDLLLQRQDVREFFGPLLGRGVVEGEGRAAGSTPGGAPGGTRSTTSSASGGEDTTSSASGGGTVSKDLLRQRLTFHMEHRIDRAAPSEIQQMEAMPLFNWHRDSPSLVRGYGKKVKPAITPDPSGVCPAPDPPGPGSTRPGPGWIRPWVDPDPPALALDEEEDACHRSGHRSTDVDSSSHPPDHGGVEDPPGEGRPGDEDDPWTSSHFDPKKMLMFTLVTNLYSYGLHDFGIAGTPLLRRRSGVEDSFCGFARVVQNALNVALQTNARDTHVSPTQQKLLKTCFEVVRTPSNFGEGLLYRSGPTGFDGRAPVHSSGIWAPAKGEEQRAYRFYQQTKIVVELRDGAVGGSAGEEKKCACWVVALIAGTVLIVLLVVVGVIVLCCRGTSKEGEDQRMRAGEVGASPAGRREGAHGEGVSSSAGTEE